MIRKLAFISATAVVATILAADIITDLIGKRLFSDIPILAVDIAGLGLAYLWLRPRRTP